MLWATNMREPGGYTKKRGADGHTGEQFAPVIIVQILIIQGLIMKWLPAFFLFILLLAMTAPVTAAAISDSVIQPSGR